VTGTPEAARLFSEAPLFAGLDREAIDALATRAFRRSFARGQTVFVEGELGRSLFVVADGLVKVAVTSPAGAELALTTLRPPDSFGELPLIDGGPRSASATALVDTTLLALDRDTFLAVIEERPELLDSLLRSLGSLLRRLTEQAGDLVFLDLHARVAKLLLRLAEREGRYAEDRITLDLRLTQSDLADLVGGSRQSVNQILRSFERRGLLELHGREIRIVSWPPLARRAGLRDGASHPAAAVDS
jgi:CRP/FNR family cyclic AMP-dependent transcriptional regulator